MHQGCGAHCVSYAAFAMDQDHIVDLSPTDDAALLALFWPFRTGVLSLPSTPVLFFGARPGGWVIEQPQAQWRCEQGFLPFVRALQRHGIAAEPEIADTGFELTLALPPRQREEARALLARAVRATVTGGRVVVAAGNNEGARSLEADLAALAGPVQSLSKHKSRVVWATIEPDSLDPARLADWLALDVPRQVTAGDEVFWSRPGLFAWDRIDPASALLVEHLPASLQGRVADLGAGWGYLSMQLLRRCAGVTALDLYEANARALEPARRNLAAMLAGRAAPACAVHWHDVTTGLPTRCDVAISNPPFHVGRADLPQLGRAFLASAADALLDHGQFWLVANRHLPYEDLLRERFAHVAIVLQRDGYKILHAREPTR